MTPERTDRAAPTDLAARLAAATRDLRAHATALVGGRGPIDPEDVVQETLSRAWTHRASFDPARPLLPWLRAVALRCVIDLRARGGRAPGPLEGEPSAGRPADALAARDEVRALLARLPDREREVLDRFHRRGESIRDLAADLGLPEGTVKSLLHRARRRLAEGGRP